jgi:hypothetical protein
MVLLARPAEMAALVAVFLGTEPAEKSPAPIVMKPP